MLLSRTLSAEISLIGSATSMSLFAFIYIVFIYFPFILACAFAPPASAVTGHTHIIICKSTQKKRNCIGFYLINYIASAYIYIMCRHSYCLYVSLYSAVRTWKTEKTVKKRKMNKMTVTHFTFPTSRGYIYERRSYNGPNFNLKRQRI